MSGTTNTLVPSNPLIPQGTLNRLRGSVIVPAFPQLTVINSYLAKEGISLSFEGEGTGYIETMTGAVTSPAPYVICGLQVAILKTQGLASLYETQRQTDSRLGQITVRLDASTLPDYLLQNAVIENIGELTSRGESASYMINMKGYLTINNALFNLL